MCGRGGIILEMGEHATPPELGRVVVSHVLVYAWVYSGLHPPPHHHHRRLHSSRIAEAHTMAPWTAFEGQATPAETTRTQFATAEPDVDPTIFGADALISATCVAVAIPYVSEPYVLVPGSPPRWPAPAFRGGNAEGPIDGRGIQKGVVGYV